MNPILSQEGWFVLHLYYQLDRGALASVPAEERLRILESFQGVLSEFSRYDNCQAHLYSVWGHKADFALMLIDPDLNHLNQAEYDLLGAFPAGALRLEHSFTSMTEVSEYISQDRDYDRTLQEKEGLQPGSAEYDKKMEAFRARIQVYVEARLHPRIPEHRVMCFYPMNKARRDQNNWYLLDFEQRKELMNGHLITGRKFTGKVSQLVTGSLGLDQWEWGVSLFADDPFYLKKILYDMRYDEVSAVYGEFGDFIVGIREEPEALFRRLRLV